jgi:AraC-like DNA-binding protein
VGIIDTSSVSVEIKTYDKQETSDQHGFVQLVLPVSGGVHLAVEASRKLLNPLHAAIVPAGAWHSQYGVGDNRSLILDVDLSVFVGGAWDRLIEVPFTEIGAAARKLVEFMQVSVEAGTVSPAQLQGWIPLLFDTMVLGAPQPQSRLAVLLAQIEADPALPWTTDSMARYASMSVSRLHALFQEELNTSPRAWLLQKRLGLACELLVRTNRTIIDIALSTGFADQSSLTRAMRQNLATTPAAHRQRRQETRHKSQ